VALAVGGDDRVPGLPGGDHGVELTQDRGGGDGLRLGGPQLVLLPADQVLVAGPVDRVGPLRSPDRAAGRQPQTGASLAGELGPPGERAGQFLPRGQAGVLDQRAGGGEPVRVTGLGQIAAAPIADRPVIEVTSPVSSSSSSTVSMRASVSACRRCAWSQGKGMPAAAVFWSPNLDLSSRDDSTVTLDPADPILTYATLLVTGAKAYAGDVPLDDPRVSPLYALSKGFSPALIVVGTKEMLLSSSVRFYQALEAARQPVKLDVYEGMWHVFPQYAAYGLPESKLAVARSTRFINDHLNQ
jgi:hypothetical protein